MLRPGQKDQRYLINHEQWQLVVLVLGIAVLAWLAVYGPGPAYRRDIRAADALRRKLEPMLAADPRFAKISMVVSTEPALYVRGSVLDEGARRDLEQLFRRRQMLVSKLR